MGNKPQALTPILNELLSNEADIEVLLPKADLELFRKMLDGYWKRCIGGKSHTEDSVRATLTTVLDMVRFTAKGPWLWSEEDFDAWTFDIFANRRDGKLDKDGKPATLSKGSQRKYQVNIKMFMEYIVSIQTFCNQVSAGYGVRLRQICHKWNMMPHVVENESGVERQAFTHEELDRFFSTIDDMISEAYAFSTKSLYPLMRDKALFCTMYGYGLRRQEVAGAKRGSFIENLSCPAFGNYGFLGVWGKGANGSGPRFRNVPLTDSKIPAVMDWYFDEVRPHFMEKANPNEEHIFLSERGDPLCGASINSRFDKILVHSGINKEGLCTHSLRHSSVTHESHRFSIITNQKKHGHVHASTTQGYTHMGDDFVSEELVRVTSREAKKK